MSTLDKQFTATLQKSPSKGGWTFVVMPGSAEYFGTRGPGEGHAAPSTATRSAARSWPSATAGTSCRSRPTCARPSRSRRATR